MKALEIIKKPAEAIANKAGRLGLKLSNHAPEALVGLGVAGVIGATILACKATIKAQDILKETADTLDDIQKVLDSDETYSEQDATKDKAILYTQTGVKLLRCYGPALAVGTLSLGSILYGHNVRRKRYLAASAAWAASQADYKALLKKIRNAYGEDAEKKLKYGIEDSQEDYEEINDDGTVTTGTREVSYAKDPPSLYARIFDETCAEWRKDPVHNMAFLRSVEKEATKTLHKRGFLTLNEVYEALGFEQNPHYGNEAGWILGYGDDFVDFGIFDDLEDNVQKRRFINGYERSVLLDFNCIGRIREHA